MMRHLNEAASLAPRLTGLLDAPRDGAPLSEIPRVVGEALDAAAVAFLFDDAGRRVEAAWAWHRDPGKQAILQEFVGCVDTIDPARSPFVATVVRGECVVVAQPTAAELASMIGHDGAEALVKVRVASLLMCPIRAGGTVIGGCSLLRSEGEATPGGAEQRELVAALDGVGERIAEQRLAHRLAGHHEPVATPTPVRRFTRRTARDPDALLREDAALTQGVLDAALDAIVTVELDGTIVGFNRAAERLFGRPADEVLGDNAGDVLIAEAERSRYRAGLAQLAGDPTWDAAYRYEITVVDAHGRTFPVEVSTSPVPGTPPRMTGHIRDLSDRRRRGRQDARIAELTRRALGGDPVDALLHEACAAIDEVLQPVRSEVWAWGSGPGHAVRQVPGDDATEGAWPLGGPSAEVVRHVPLQGGDLELPADWIHAGLRQAVVAQIDPARGPYGALVVGFVDPRELAADELDFVEILANVLSAAIDRRLADQEITFRALHDPVTGLPNRGVLLERLSDALSGLGDEGSSLALVILDVEQLQRFNDTAGHRAGDELLAQLGGRLQAVLGPNDTLARLAGDEFAVILPGADDVAAVEATRRLLAAAGGSMCIEHHEVDPSLTAGIAVTSDPAGDAHALLRDADLALARVERGGRRYEVFDPAMRAWIAERVEVESGLRKALREDALRLAYQPIVSLADGRIVGAEALLRWHGADLGKRGPADVVPIAEESGLIEPIGRWALDEACRQLARWEGEAGLDLGYVAVNVSARQLRDERLVPVLAEALESRGLAPQRLAVEVTETVLMAESPATFAVLQRLRDLGVRVLLDDFGTGYSSLGYLHRFPLDGVKIDRAFAQDLADGRAVPIVEAVVKMAHALGLDVIAEGVESVEQARRLRRLGCAVAQGYAFAKPLAGEALESVLRHGVVSADTDGAFGPVKEERGAGAPAEPWLRGEDATMTLGEAAHALGVSASTLRRWADGGRLSTVRTTGGHRRFVRAEVARLSGRAVSAPKVRAPADEPGATPAASEVLEAHRDAVARLAGRSIYEEGAFGWLATDAAADPLERWSLDVAAACRSGDEEAAAAAVLRLHDDAADGGASLVEVDAFLGSCLGLLVRELQRRDASEDEIVDVRRLFGRLRRRLLAHAVGQ